MFRPSRARRALLLVAFSVLTSAATAHAECAWVLWGHDMAKDRLPHVWPVGAWESKEECQEQPLFRTQYPRKPDLEKYSYFVCLPDTVDPRGPKSAPR